MIVYKTLQSSLGLVSSVFFRQIEVVGLEHVPREGDGPVIFVGNHPNSLLDPALVIAYCGRIVHFAAKDVLFRNPVAAALFRALGAVPISRRSDHTEGAIDNQGTFDTLFEVLVRGRTMGIFPEGLSHDDSQLARLKTGAARIALGVADRHPGLGVRIVPCGLNYVQRKRFRTRVLIQFGPGITVTDEDLARWKIDERGEVRALTDRIETAIRGLTVNADDWETLRVLDGVRRLYQPAGISFETRIELSRRFAAVYPTVRAEPEVAAAFERVRAYLDRLREAGLSDRDLRADVTARDAIPRLARHLMLLFVWLPLAQPGVAIFLPLGMLIRLASKRLTPRSDVLATTKFVMGAIGVLAVLTVIPALVAFRAGPLAAVTSLVLLILSGYATVRVIERGNALRHLLVTLGRLVSLRREVEALRIERASLETVVADLVDRHRPADMISLFPRETGEIVAP